MIGNVDRGSGGGGSDPVEDDPAEALQAASGGGTVSTQGQLDRGSFGGGGGGGSDPADQREQADVVEASPYRSSQAESKVVDADGGERETVTVTEAAPNRQSEGANAVLDGKSTTEGYGSDPVNNTAEAIDAAGGTSYEEGKPASEGGAGGMPGSPGLESATDHEGDSSQSGIANGKDIIDPTTSNGGGAAGDAVNTVEMTASEAAKKAKNAATPDVPDAPDVGGVVKLLAVGLLAFLGAQSLGGESSS